MVPKADWDHNFFHCTINSTTFSDIYGAVQNDGQIPVALYPIIVEDPQTGEENEVGNRIYMYECMVYDELQDAYYYKFACADEGIIHYAVIGQDDQWTLSSMNLQSQLTFDNAPTDNSNNPVKSCGIYTALGNKVDVVNGKGLSTNDFTDSYKNAVDANSQKVSNVQSDWNAISGAAQILNKPTLANVATSGSYADLSNKIEFNTAYDATTNKAATMADVTGIYRIQGNASVVDLNNADKSTLSTGFVYNIMGASGDLLNSDTTTVSVSEGDNVVFIGGGSSWEWDKLAATISLSGYVPISRTVNNKALSSDITLYSNDVLYNNLQQTTVKDKLDALSSAVIKRTFDQTPTLEYVYGQVADDYFLYAIPNTPDYATVHILRLGSSPYIYSVEAEAVTSGSRWTGSNLSGSTVLNHLFDATYAAPYALASDVTTLSNTVANKQDKPVLETYTITSWTADSNIAPFTYKATATATATIGANTVVELLNDNAINFATYGFNIGDITSQTITFYSIGQPSSNVSLKVRIGD